MGPTMKSPLPTQPCPGCLDRIRGRAGSPGARAVDRCGACCGGADNDGLKDGVEVRRYKTNPCDKDTDNGGVRDGVEVQAGSDPLDPDSTPKNPRRAAERTTG